jgi:membrane fusion protein (multidrug efflux system)
MAAGRATVSVKVHAYPGREFTGKVVRTSPGLEAASRTVAVEAELANPDDRLMPGMYARVRMNLGKRENALLLPLKALVDRRAFQAKSKASPSRRSMADGQTRVFVVRNGKARQVPVVLGVRNERYAEILSGLNEGARVITDGRETARDGRPVRIVRGPSTPSQRATDPKSADGSVKDNRRGTL